MALIDANLAGQAPEVRQAATDFCSYLFTPEAQREFAACGFRCGAGGVRRGLAGVCGAPVGALPATSPSACIAG